MNSVLYPLCAGLNLLALVYKLRVLLRDRSPVQWALVGNFFFPFLIYAVSTPTVWVAVSHATGIVNFSGLFTQSCVMLLTASQQLVLLHLTYERRVAWRKAAPRLAGIGLTLATMVTLFSAATYASESPTDFAISRALFSPAYLVVYLIAYTWNQIDVCILCWRYARIAPTPWLRRGLRLVALSLPAALAYSASRTADVVAAQFGVAGHAWEPIVPVAVTINTIAKTVGWTLPDWGRYLTSLWENIDRRTTHRKLKSFHREVTTHIPDLVLKLDQGLDMQTRLYRLVIEIRDAQRALRIWMDPQVTRIAQSKAEAAGLEGDDRSATIEAAQLKAALRAKVIGAQPTAHTSAPHIAEPQSLAAELVFQRKMARAFARSPIVASVLTSVSPTPATPQEGTT